ncbi:WhiB family transcriptional regulator [Streptomyces bobili]|uniref:WhiB family transcriptional regulator n=1 Tax=Streptomyces bobili TaxID=67280 RepID=UPI003789078F
MTTLAALTATTPGLPCRTTDPELWFSRSSSERALAVALCQECPIRRACAQYALDNPEVRGVWGGTTAADRRSFRDGRPWRFDEQGRLRLECGSEEAYRSHFGYREQPCEVCVAAHEEHITGQRRVRLAVEHARADGGSTVGYWLHRRLGERACRACMEALQVQQSLVPSRVARRRGERARTASVAPEVAETVRGPQTGAQPLALAG